MAANIRPGSPLAVNVQSYGTGTVSDERLRDVVLKTFDLRTLVKAIRLEIVKPGRNPRAGAVQCIIHEADLAFAHGVKRAQTL